MGKRQASTEEAEEEDVAKNDKNSKHDQKNIAGKYKREEKEGKEVRR